MATGSYSYYLWRTRGLKGFASIAAIPIAALVGTRLATNEGLSYVRDYLFYFQRKELVRNYTEKYGEKFLLNVLNPAFRLWLLI